MIKRKKNITKHGYVLAYFYLGRCKTRIKLSQFERGGQSSSKLKNRRNYQKPIKEIFSFMFSGFIFSGLTKL